MAQPTKIFGNVVERRNLRRFLWSDLYHFLIERSWAQLLGLTVADALLADLDRNLAAPLDRERVGVLLGLLLDRMGSIRDELSPPVQLARIDKLPRKPRRRRSAPADGAAAMASDEHSVSLADRSAAAARSA